jgi:hypothetical protein
VSTRLAVLLVASTVFSSRLVSACSCVNSTPVQKTTETYARRTVFTARVVQSIGGVYNFNGERTSGRAIAIVERRYWGFPAYWPGIVILDGGGLCGMGILEGQEYFVSAYRSNRYGVFLVGGCSRTQPLRGAVDVRTLDGSHCAGEGGTLLGHVSYSVDKDGKSVPVRNTLLTFRDFYGKAYVTRSDDEGIYELAHVPGGLYTLDSRIEPDRYAAGGGEVRVGVCTEAAVYLSPYTVTGRLLSGIAPHARVSLMPINGGGNELSAGVGLDGRFYFKAVPAGDYFLAARFNLAGRNNQWADLYYPGVRARDHAARVHISGQTRAPSLDFDADAIPLTPVPVLVESPDPSRPIRVVIRLLDSGGHAVNQFAVSTGNPVEVAVIRGERYELSVLDSEDYRTLSKTIRVTAVPRMALTRILLTGGR